MTVFLGGEDSGLKQLPGKGLEWNFHQSIPVSLDIWMPGSGVALLPKHTSPALFPHHWLWHQGQRMDHTRMCFVSDIEGWRETNAGGLWLMV